MLKKDNLPKELEEQFEFYKRFYENDIKFFEYKGYYLDFKSNRKLRLLEKLNIILGQKRFVVFPNVKE